MYDIEQTEYGIRVELGGTISAAEMESFREEVTAAVEPLDEGFGVVADMQGAALSEDAKEVLARTMAETDRAGFERSAVAVDSPILDLQQEQLEADAGVDGGERVIDANAVGDWESEALDWVKHGIEPDT